MVVLAAVQLTIGLMAAGMGVLAWLCIHDDEARAVALSAIGIILAVALVIGGLALLDIAGVIGP